MIERRWRPSIGKRKQKQLQLVSVDHFAFVSSLVPWLRQRRCHCLRPPPPRWRCSVSMFDLVLDTFFLLVLLRLRCSREAPSEVQTQLKDNNDTHSAALSSSGLSRVQSFPLYLWQENQFEAQQGCSSRVAAAHANFSSFECKAIVFRRRPTEATDWPTCRSGVRGFLTFEWPADAIKTRARNDQSASSFSRVN